jgi:hypothetical protein
LTPLFNCLSTARAGAAARIHALAAAPAGVIVSHPVILASDLVETRFIAPTDKTIDALKSHRFD